MGVDLGTTSSCAAIFDSKGLRIISTQGISAEAEKTFPSVVAVTGEGRVVVGERARLQLSNNHESAVSENEGQARHEL